MDTNSRKMQYAKLIPVLAVGLLLALGADPAHATRFRIPVTLNGAQQVPPVNTAGTGTARLLLNTITRRITGSVNFSGLTSATLAGHIHRAPAGVNGGVIIPLSGGLGVTSGRMTVNATLTAAQLRSLMTNKLYLNIHTVNFGNGEIRGQIRWARRVRLASADQVPMLTVASGDSSIERLGRGLVEPSSEGSAFVTRAWAARAETPGDRVRFVKADLARNRLDDLGD
jgi:hypothetical protein